MTNSPSLDKTKWWHRLANVCYYFGLVISVFAAVGIFVSVHPNRVWIPYFNSTRFLAFGLTGLSIITGLELSRRIAAYVSFNTNFLDKKFSKLFSVLALLFIVSVLGSGFLKYIAEPSFETKWKIEQKILDEQLLVKLEVQLKQEVEDAKVCIATTQQQDLEIAKTTCEARYRKVKLGYDSCMKYGWHTMCLQYDDYEIIDCSEEALKKSEESYHYRCASDALVTKNKVDNLKEKIANAYK